MAWIRMLDDEEIRARGDRLTRLCRAAVDDRTGRLDNILRVHTLRPETLDGHLHLYRSIMRASTGLSRREREVMAVAVSAYNHCHY